MIRRRHDLGAPALASTQCPPDDYHGDGIPLGEAVTHGAASRLLQLAPPIWMACADYGQLNPSGEGDDDESDVDADQWTAGEASDEAGMNGRRLL